MRIRCSFTVDVDPDAWALEYGTDRSEVREDVQRHAEHSFYAHLEQLGLIAPKRIPAGLEGLPMAMRAHVQST